MCFIHSWYFVPEKEGTGWICDGILRYNLLGVWVWDWMFLTYTAGRRTTEMMVHAMWAQQWKERCWPDSAL
jgi:hypothetical protein